MSRTIVVTGATGAQGGGLVRAILEDPDRPFAARAVTRDPGSEAARRLADAGAEIVQADLDDAGSLSEAFDGAYGAFCMTNFWEHFSPEREKAQAANLARAARNAGIGHAIWSTLEDVRRFVPLDDHRMPTLMGQYKVPHFDAKGEADALFRDAGIPTTYLRTSFYWDNLISFGMGPKRDEEGRLAITFPLAQAPLPSIAAEDIGRCAYGIFVGGKRWIGATVGIAGDHVTGEEMAAGLTAALGEQVRYDAVSPQAYRSLGFPGAEDLGNMFQFKVDFSGDYCAERDLATSRELNPRLMSFHSWAQENAGHIPLD
ncbi:MAG: NmrA family NAD(P)-binding protein [Solirubrobacteraceae bacterium]